MERGLVSELSSSLMEEALEFRMAILAASLADLYSCLATLVRRRRIYVPSAGRFSWPRLPRLRVGDWHADRLEWIVS